MLNASSFIFQYIGTSTICYKYSIYSIVKYTLLLLTIWFSRLSIILLWTRCSPWISFTSREIFSNFDIISWISSRELWHILSSVSFEVLNADILACRSCSLLKIYQTLVIDTEIMDCLKNASTILRISYVFFQGTNILLCNEHTSTFTNRFLRRQLLWLKSNVIYWSISHSGNTKSSVQFSTTWKK